VNINKSNAITPKREKDVAFVVELVLGTSVIEL
jgi:hypothetical protein